MKHSYRFPGMAIIVHGEYLSVIDSPESQQVFAELGAFLLQQLKK